MAASDRSHGSVSSTIVSYLAGATTRGHVARVPTYRPISLHCRVYDCCVSFSLSLYCYSKVRYSLDEALECPPSPTNCGSLWPQVVWWVCGPPGGREIPPRVGSPVRRWDLVPLRYVGGSTPAESPSDTEGKALVVFTWNNSGLHQSPPPLAPVFTTDSHASVVRVWGASETHPVTAFRT